jgi:polysaccharide biosynthesis protein PslH
MRVAVVTPYLPWPADTGGKLRSFYLIRGLARAHEVDLYSVYYGSRPDAGPLEDICACLDLLPLTPAINRPTPMQQLIGRIPRSVSFFQTAESLVYLRGKLSQSYDLLVADEIVMEPYLTDLTNSQAVPRLVARQKIDHLHYLEMAKARPWGRDKFLDWLEGRKLRSYERQVMPAFQAATTCSAEDARAVRAEAGRELPVEVIVNGADTEYFTPQRAPAETPTVLLIGTMHYYPNVDATLYFFRTIYPALRNAVPNVQVLIVGHLPPPEIVALGDLPGVTVTGSVPDVRPYMARSWVLAVPLRLGGGTRLKIMEAMAAGLPVVSTSVGAQGIDAVHGQHFLLADNPLEFAQLTAQLLQNSSLGLMLATNGRQRVEQCYSWQALGQRFAQFCHLIALGNDRNRLMEG